MRPHQNTPFICCCSASLCHTLEPTVGPAVTKFVCFTLQQVQQKKKNNLFTDFTSDVPLYSACLCVCVRACDISDIFTVAPQIAPGRGIFGQAQTKERRPCYDSTLKPLIPLWMHSYKYSSERAREAVGWRPGSSRGTRPTTPDDY